MFLAARRSTASLQWLQRAHALLQRSIATHPTFNDPRLKPGTPVVVGMSGGVDSSVTLKLLTGRDLDLSAVFMRNWTEQSQDSTQLACQWEADWQDVQIICKQLDVPCRMIDLSNEYWTRVFEPALDQWAGGLNPNPDVSCNREIKFGALMDRVLPNPDALLATGHYARIDHSVPGQTRMLHALDISKDQSLFLSSVPEAKLKRAVFPLGHLHKSEVRRIAAEHGLHTVKRKESMGLCFVEPKQKFNEFLNEYITPNPGPIYNESGAVVGEHHGLWSFQIGQRWKVGGRNPGDNARLYIAGKSIKDNAIHVVEGSDHPALLTPFFRAHSWDWIHGSPPAEVDDPAGLPIRIKIFSARGAVPGTLRRGAKEGEFRLDYAEGVHNEVSAPGQSVVVYVGDWCLGSGIIAEREWIFESPGAKGSVYEPNPTRGTLLRG